MLNNGTLLLVGCGKMGGAMLQGWLDRGLKGSQVAIVDPSARADYMQTFVDDGVQAVETLADLGKSFLPDYILFAVKPQMIDSAITDYQNYARQGTVFLSVIAGKQISFFEKHLGTDAAIVRTMPNTPAAVSRGMTVLYGNQNISKEQADACEELMAAVGETAWLDSEEQIDAVTGVSGSGPAYIFYLAECLAQAGVDAGLPKELARKLADTTVSGAGELLRLSNDSPSQLRINVTSPNGTTQAALDVLMAADGLQPVMNKAVAAAANRSRELL
ncbi:pyrroline-5-carboxylate reductase [Kiloniella sp. EL199]|uniref:pyrroline-5-carboxylate reductase n=1 Tax=Kiloniella sp. EL199 TaxID=2107581 RepID=UPI000EA13731|nr:pyrroline-5-carboxylate reductase [Kiloniella sp. EL199]